MGANYVTLIFLQICILLIQGGNCISGPELTITNITEMKIHVEWTPAILDNKVVEKYQVSAYPVRSYGKMDTLNRNEWTFFNTTRSSELLGLHPGTLYNISVWAVTKDGHTDPSTQIVWTEIGDPEEPDPVEIIERNGETMTIVLPTGYSDKGPITSYHVVAIEKSPIIFFNPDEVGNYSMSQETGLPFYITANLTPEQANQSFIIGDKKTYNGYYNAPLSKEHDYEVLVGVVSSLNGHTKISYSPLQSTIEKEMSDDVYEAQTSSKLSVMLSAAIGVFGFLLVISVIIYILLRKHYGKRRPSDEMVLKVHGSDAKLFKDENGFVPGMLQINDDADLSEIYENLREKYWQIPKSNLDVHQTVLGVGQFGEVREGIVHRKGQAIPCIVQYMQAPSLLMEKEHKHLLCELDLLSRVNMHTNVVEFIGACDERDVLQVAIEHHPSSLRGLLLRSRQQPGGKVTNLSEPLLLELASGVARGMAHLADRGILHRHLSTRNILITEGTTPKVAHFGLGYYNPLGKRLMYTRWTAPEVLNLNTFTSKSDVWSFAVLLWEILTLGGSPYVSLPSRDVLPRVMQGMRLPQPKGVYDDLYQLMLQCWELDPDERPKFMELATSLQTMILNVKEHLNFQDCVNYQYAKFDPSAEDQ